MSASSSSASSSSSSSSSSAAAALLLDEEERISQEQSHHPSLGFGKSLCLGLIFGAFLAVANHQQNHVWGSRRSDVRRALEAKRPKDTLLPVQVESQCLEGTGWDGARTVNRDEAMHLVNSDIPFQTGPLRATVYSRGLDEGDEADVFPAHCEEVDVVVMNDADTRCLLVAESSEMANYHLIRFQRTESQWWNPVSRIHESKQRMPKEGSRKHAQSLLKRFLENEAEMKAQLEPVLAEAARHTHPDYKASAKDGFKGAVLLMCINEGNLDLLFNFVLSACERKIDVGNLIVFAADAAVESALKLAGIKTYAHGALGTFNPTAARSYGDHTFVEMMWLKTTCVYLVNALGYDALFQDADLFWWSDPWPAMASRPDLDTAWMDDGARTSRFAPHYMNTGFYLVRANKRTALFCRHLLGLHDTVLAWQSHQSVVSQVAAEYHALHAMTLKILDKEKFASGKQLHHNKPLFEKISKKISFPVVFHMCWTAGKADKLKFLKQESLWYLPKKCSTDAMSRAALKGDRTFIQGCVSCTYQR